jgi:ABC-type multidrug transport system fused ATPase/permease subunit
MSGQTNLEFLFFVIISILCGLSLRLSLGYAKQLWSQTYHYTLTLSLLPPITMVITSLISGNIALSLGMIGALSIVRFRNPVKSPFELIIFFGLITVGIGMAVNYKYGVGLTVIINFIIITFKILDNYFEKKGKKIFSYSFEEGNQLNIIQIKAKSKIKAIENHSNLNELTIDNINQTFSYELLFASKKELEIFKKEIENQPVIEELLVRYGN